MDRFAGIPGYLALFVGSLLAYFIAGRVTAWARLRSFPGPFSTNFTNWPHRKALLQQRCHEFYGEVCEKYGSITPSCLLSWMANAICYDTEHLLIAIPI
jgi:hypothetical protein